MEKREAIKTGVSGFDALLGEKKGFEINKNTDNLLIVIRGQRGISKVNLAMNIIKGVCCSLNKEDSCRFYSLNKNRTEIQEQYEKLVGLSNNVLDEIFRNDKTESNTYMSSKLVQFVKISQEISDIDLKEKLACIVIDGFAGLTTEEFNTIPLNALEENLRKKTKIAILIFDDRLTNQSTNADIIIEMRRSFDKSHNYTYHELAISKSIFQSVTHGWHKYKHLDNGKIEVYPSVHKILSDIKPIKAQFETLLNGEQNYKPQNLKNNTSKVINLDNVLYPKSGKVTSIIGASNTFKRYLTALSVSIALEKGKRCLVVLFNESKSGFISVLNNVDNTLISNSNLQFFEIPMGCVSPAEFINMMQEYVLRFTENCCNNRVALFMLDLLELDYSFPMLCNETLFLPALASVCKNNQNSEHQPNVSLHLVCNKRFSLVNTVISISDDVLCTQRELDDNKQLTIYLEKNSFGADHNSKVYQCECEILQDENNDDKNKVILDTKFDEISTTTDFWRQAVNIKNKIDVNLLNRQENEEEK